MPKRLAITIAGAVSLGTYEAGVLYEVIEAIRQHNADPSTTPEDKIVIDVLTGASAGGMAAIILAQKLLLSAQEFVGPYNNPLYNTWVTRISLAALQATGKNESALKSLFSSDLIESISREALMKRYVNSPPLPAQPHSAVMNAMRVGVALTNLDGIVYRYPVEPDGQFAYVDYCDQFTRYVGGPQSDTPAFWESLRAAAVAGGAFPFAFRAQEIERSAKTEPDDYTADNLQPWDHDPRKFTYSDGGILHNQPLGIAKNLVDLNDRHMAQDSRYYLFVSPHAKDVTEYVAFPVKSATHAQMARKLFDVVVGQAGFRDWITARGVNGRISVLDTQARRLKDAILQKDVDVDAFAATSASLIELLFASSERVGNDGERGDTLSEARSRISAQYCEEIDSLPGTADKAAFRDCVLAIETAAGLGARDHMTIYGVTATSGQLAGAGLYAFLGFFNQRFREHDYDVGRAHARKWLTDPSLSQPKGIGPIRYKGTPIRPIDKQLDGLKLKNVPPPDLHFFKAGLRTRFNQMLSEMWGPHFSLVAVPGADFLLNCALDYLIARS